MNKKKTTKDIKILIVDDNPSILDSIKTMLTDEGYTVTTTMDGDTIDKVREVIPDVLLLDIWMSGINGLDICKDLKSQDITKKIPIIIISANKEISQLSQAVGADDFLEKPFEMEELLAMVAKQIKK